MVSMVSIASFFGLAFVMALSPGPNLLYLASRSICQGRAAGFASLCGVCTGMFLYMLATAAGLSALFEAVPVAYDIVRLAGAAYLLWLAFNLCKGTRVKSAQTSLKTYRLASESRVALFRRGLLICLLNPKIVVTYSAFLPQFVEPTAGSVVIQLIVLGLVQIAAAASAHSLVIMGASFIEPSLTHHPVFARCQKFLLATLFTGMATRLILDHQSTS